MTLKMKIKKARPNADIMLPFPCYATPGSSGLDLHAAIDGPITISGIAIIPTGICIELPPGYEGVMRPRSGLASQGVFSILGTIDNDYRGEIFVILHVVTPGGITIQQYDRIAQLVVQKVERVEVEVVEFLSQTQRGGGGFGSTGK